MPTWPEPKPHPHTIRAPRRFDQTQLRESGNKHRVHRDYAAHFFRWGFAARFHVKGCRSLEVGCGQDLPLAKVLRANIKAAPSLHVAVDLNKIQKKLELAWIRIHDETSFVDAWPKLVKAYGRHTLEIATCFEVIEHMQVKDGRKLLRGVHELLTKDGTFLLSTPIYNGKHMAANHLHEYQEKELRYEVERAGFRVDRQHGTFMTSQAMKRVCPPQERQLLEELHQFYDWDVLANFLAPKYPHAASNCCWVLRPA